MAEGDELGYSINTALMDDMLRLVFSKLETKNEKDAFGLVCKRWLQIQNTERRYLQIRSNLQIMLPRMAFRFPAIVELDLSRCVSSKFSHAYPSVIAKGFPLLRHLNLTKCRGISKAMLIRLSNFLPQLQSLDVSFCENITDNGLISVTKRCHNLRRLHLSYCKYITDNLLQALSKNSSHLEDLKLKGCDRITDSGIICLVDGCRQIKSLDITSCTNIGDSGISKLAEVCSSSLKVLKLSYCKQVKKSILSLMKCGCKLETLLIASCRLVYDQPIRSLAMSCYQSLRILNIRWCIKITDLTLSSIFSNCRYLTALDIEGCRNVTDAGFEGLKCGGFSSALKVLNASWLNKITVAAIKTLLEFCKCLDYLGLSSCPFVSIKSCCKARIEFPESCKVDFWMLPTVELFDLLF